MLDLESIKRRLKEATQGTWAHDGGLEIAPLLDSDFDWSREIAAVVSSDADAELIAHAPADLAALIGEVERLRTAAGLALSALRARRDVEEHMMEAAQYENCPDCCNQRPCPKFERLETIAQNAAAYAMAALRGALAKEGT